VQPPAAATTGLRKLLSAMQSDDASAARELAGRVHLLGRQQQRQKVPATASCR
jgi:hypothetical protein